MWPQLAIAIAAPASFLLLARRRRLGFIVSLLGQPFWLWIATHPVQYGLLFVNCFYFCTAIYGWCNWRAADARAHAHTPLGP